MRPIDEEWPQRSPDSREALISPPSEDGSFPAVLSAWDALPWYLRDGFTRIARMDEKTLDWLRQSSALTVQAEEAQGTPPDALERALRGTAVSPDAIVLNPLRWPTQEAAEDRERVLDEIEASESLFSDTTIHAFNREFPSRVAFVKFQYKVAHDLLKNGATNEEIKRVTYMDNALAAFYVNNPESSTTLKVLWSNGATH